MVEIRIDTKRDSDDEIRKTIRFLQGIVGDAPSSGSGDGSGGYGGGLGGGDYGLGGGSGDPAPGAFSMFGSDDDAPSDYSPGASGASSSGTLDDPDEEKDESAFIEIVEY